jgi:TonB family protein
VVVHGAALGLSLAAHATALAWVREHPPLPSVVVAAPRPGEVDLEVEVAADLPRDSERQPEPARGVAPAHALSDSASKSHERTPHEPGLARLVALPATASSPISAIVGPSASAAPALTSESMPHFTIPIGPASPAASGAPAAQAGGDDPGEAVVSEERVSAPARLAQGVLPAYPAEARAQGVEADVPLEIVVSRSGAVLSARVTHEAGSGFDGAALEAIRAYRFTPAVLDGRPTVVRMRWTMQFRLR